MFGEQELSELTPPCDLACAFGNAEVKIPSCWTSLQPGVHLWSSLCLSQSLPQQLCQVCASWGYFGGFTYRILECHLALPAGNVFVTLSFDSRVIINETPVQQILNMCLSWQALPQYLQFFSKLAIFFFRFQKTTELFRHRKMSWWLTVQIKILFNTSDQSPP